MNRKLLALTACCAVLFIFLPVLPVKADKTAVVTAARMNGTWKSATGTFHVSALGGQRLQVTFYGVFRNNAAGGPSLNEGEGSGIAFIEGDTAIFKPEEAEEECRITMKFAKGRLIVTQEGTCGFGFRVRADGAYRKVRGVE